MYKYRQSIQTIYYGKETSFKKVMVLWKKLHNPAEWDKVL